MMKFALQFDSTHAPKTHLLLCASIGPKTFLHISRYRINGTGASHG